MTTDCTLCVCCQGITAMPWRRIRSADPTSCSQSQVAIVAAQPLVCAFSLPSKKHICYACVVPHRIGDILSCTPSSIAAAVLCPNFSCKSSPKVIQLWFFSQCDPVLGLVRGEFNQCGSDGEGSPCILLQLSTLGTNRCRR